MLKFNKILFPTDFSSNADMALAHAIRLADFNDGEVIVQHVVGDFFENHSHWATLCDVRELQNFMHTYATAHLAKITATDSGKVKLVERISKGKPAAEIAALADREMVDMVVMGSAKGSITNTVIRMTNRPVLAVSATHPRAQESNLRRLANILVATDFSEHSKRVIDYAFDLKRIFAAKIHMLYVIETGHAVEFAIRQGCFIHCTDKMREWAGNQLMNLTPDEFAKDSSVNRLVEAGDPSDIIAHIASAVDVWT